MIRQNLSGKPVLETRPTMIKKFKLLAIYFSFKNTEKKEDKGYIVGLITNQAIYMRSSPKEILLKREHFFASLWCLRLIETFFYVKNWLIKSKTRRFFIACFPILKFSLTFVQCCLPYTNKNAKIA